jgi:hypothetical protein
MKAGIALSSLLTVVFAGCGLLKNKDDERTNAEFMAPHMVKRNRLVEAVAVYEKGSNGNPLSYRWSLDGAPDGSDAVLTGDGPTTSFMADALGKYTVTLIVDDGGHESAPVSHMIEAVNTPPEAVSVAVPDRTADLGELIQLDASGSSDCDEQPLTYRWYFDHVPSGSNVEISDPTGVSPSFVPDLPGLYAPRVVVFDGIDESEPHGTFIWAGNNSAPIADAGDDREVAIGETVTLDGGGSSDPDSANEILRYAWALIDRPVASQVDLPNPGTSVATFVPDVAGEFRIQLVVTDEKDAESVPDEVVITAR